MRRVIKIAIACAIVIAAVYTYTSIFYPTIAVRFMLTLEVKDGDQIRTGSSVLEVEYPIYPEGLVGPSSFRRFTGYAVTVDLGEKGLLCLTFNDARRTADQQGNRFHCGLSDIACLPFAAYAKAGSPYVTSTNFSAQKAALGELLRESGPRDIRFIDLPGLVRVLKVAEEHNPTIVSPFDLAASFGPGVQLSRASLELTTSPITPAPQVWPEWLKNKKRYGEYGGYEK